MINWQVEKISEARVGRRKRIDYERVRIALNEVKEIMKKEKDHQVKSHLALAGIELNKILLK